MREKKIGYDPFRRLSLHQQSLLFRGVILLIAPLGKVKKTQKMGVKNKIFPVHLLSWWIDKEMCEIFTQKNIWNLHKNKCVKNKKWHKKYCEILNFFKKILNHGAEKNWWQKERRKPAGRPPIFRSGMI